MMLRNALRTSGSVKHSPGSLQIELLLLLLLLLLYYLMYITIHPRVLKNYCVENNTTRKQLIQLN